MSHKICVGTFADAKEAIRRHKDEGGLVLFPEVTDYFNHKIGGTKGTPVIFAFSVLLASCSEDLTTTMTDSELSVKSACGPRRIARALRYLEDAGLLELSWRKSDGLRIIRIKGFFKKIPDWYQPSPMSATLIAMERGEDVPGLIYGGEKSGKTEITEEDNQAARKIWTDWKARIA